MWQSFVSTAAFIFTLLLLPVPYLYLIFKCECVGRDYQCLEKVSELDPLLFFSLMLNSIMNMGLLDQIVGCTKFYSSWLFLEQKKSCRLCFSALQSMS